jgi:hypothetical protein
MNDIAYFVVFRTLGWVTRQSEHRGLDAIAEARRKIIGWAAKRYLSIACKI